MLTILSGKEHEVYTGVALIDNRDQSMENFFERTKVTMYPVSEEEDQRLYCRWRTDG